MTLVKNSQPQVSLLTFVKRLHFYIGLFVGPFIFIAALTGTLYVLAPQLEQHIYASALQTSATGQSHSLVEQIATARASLSEELPLRAVRPAIGEGYTTRVLFAKPHWPNRLLTVFVDPVTLKIKATLPTYGTSGVLPLMTSIDFLHRGLLLGNVGRIYSELAASWMWVAALGGIWLWFCARRTKRKRASPYLRAKSYHQRAGWMILAGLLFFSATGLTWSQLAGSHIASWRQAIGWVTPSVKMALPPSHFIADIDEQERLFDPVLAIAREAGLTAAKLEIRPATMPGKAWMIREIDRSWPSQVDAISVDPVTLQITSEARFAEYPLIAKLIRWGIDAHMGVLFGLPNQLLLAAFGITLCVLILLGYRMWWLRRPPVAVASDTLVYSWFYLAPRYRYLILLIALGLGLALPVMGASLILFVGVDGIRWWHYSRRYNK